MRSLTRREWGWGTTVSLVIISACFLSGFILLDSAEAGVFPAPSGLMQYRTWYITSLGEKREPFQENFFITEEITEGSRTLVRQYQRVKYFKAAKQERSDVVFTVEEGKLRSLYAFRLLTGEKGVELVREETVFQKADQSARVFRRYQDTKEAEDFGLEDSVDLTVRGLSPDTYTRRMLPLGYSFLPLEVGFTERFRIITRVGKSFLIEMTTPEIEEIKVPAGTFRCYRVMEKVVIPGSPLRISPSIISWFAAESPHILVQYEGPQDIPSKLTHLKAFLAPTIHMELQKVEKGGTLSTEGRKNITDRLRTLKMLE